MIGLYTPLRCRSSAEYNELDHAFLGLRQNASDHKSKVIVLQLAKPRVASDAQKSLYM